MFANSQPSPSNFKTISRLHEQFFSQQVRKILVTKYHFLLFLLNDLIPRNYQFGKLQIKIKKQRIIGFCTALLHVFFLYNALEKISQLCKFSIQAKAEITLLFEFFSKFSLKYYVRSMQYVSRPFKLQSHTYHVLTIHMVK